MRNLNFFWRMFFFLALITFLIGQIIVKKEPVIAAPGSEEVLWAVSQSCDFELSNPKWSLDGPSKGFDGKSASCSWNADETDSSWRFDAFQPTGLDLIHHVRLDIAFYLEEWQPEDRIELQVANNDGGDWKTIEVWEAENSPPGDLTPKNFDVSPFFGSPNDLNLAQVRFFVPYNATHKAEFLLFVDAVSLTVSGDLTPSDTPTATVTSTETVTPSETVLPVTETITATTTSTLSSTLAGTLTSTPTSTDPNSPTATLDITQTIYPTQTITATITITTTNSFTPTPPLTPTASSTPFPTLAVNSSNATVQSLWLVNQSCDFPIKNPSGSLDLSFNSQTAACKGEFGKSGATWHLSEFEHTSFTHINDVVFDIRLSQSGWVDDQFNLEVFDGGQWRVISQFGPARSIPPQDLTVLSFNLLSVLSSAGQINQAAVRLVGIGVNESPDLISIDIDAARLSVAGGFEPRLSFGLAAIQGGAPNLSAADPSNGSPHGDQSLTSDSCAACHRSHLASGSVLRDAWPEESVCFSCHANSGPGTNVQPAFVNYQNSTNGIFTHAVTLTNGVHQLNQSSGGDFGGGNRHIECEDCHDPHASARGPSSAPVIQMEMLGISGVNPTWTGLGAPSGYNWLSQAASEYQVCFKCHSSFTNLPNYAPDGWNGANFVSNGLPKLTNASSAQIADSRDMAREFNPYQASFHPVVAQGRNQNIPSSSFVNGWSQSSMVYCSDCHQNPNSGSGGLGPHGSPLLHLLNGSANYSTVYANGSPRVSASEVCFQCHNYQVYVTGQVEVSHFKEHKKHMDNNWGTTCYTCHDTHGSEQQHLINMDASVVTFLNGRNSQTAWYYDPTNGKAGCFVSCHGKTHNPEEYEP